MFVVDTNILIYAANQHSPHFPRCRPLLDAWCQSPSPWFITWGICYEFLRVSTHRRVFRSPLSAGQSWSFLEEVLKAPGISVLVAGERHPAILAELLRESPTASGNDMHDVHTVALMREHGVSLIITHDTDFHKFRAIEVQDPLLQP